MDTIEIRDDAAVLVKIGETLYRVRPTFASMLRAVKLQDQVDRAEGGNNLEAITGMMQETRALILDASDIPEAEFDKLSYGQIRQLMDVVRGAMTEEPGKN